MTDKNSPSLHFITRSTLLWAVVLLLGGHLSSNAAIRFWTGGGANNNWNNAANWGGTAPSANDDLIFQGGGSVDATSLINTNNYGAGTVFRSITITGTNYQMYGNQVLFTNSGVVAISAQHGGGFNYVFFPIQFSATGQSFECTAGGSTLEVDGDISLNGRNLTTMPTGEIDIRGLISGTGNLVKNGAGRLLLNGIVANTYVGTCSVNAGVLELNDLAGASVNMITGDLYINNASTVELTEGNQIADTASVYFNNNGSLTLVNVSDTILNLSLAASTVSSGSGTLSLNGDITVVSNSGTPAINGNLHFNGGLHTVTVPANAALYELEINANVSDSGGGLLFTNPVPVSNFIRLLGSNSFTGPLTIQNATVSAETPWALGTTNGGTTVADAGQLWIYTTAITNESLTLAGGARWTAQYNCVWAGPVTLNGDITLRHYDAASLFDIIGVIGGTGGIAKTDSGAVRFSGSSGNSYAGTTTVFEGTLELNKSSGDAIVGPLIIGNGSGSDVVRSLQTTVIGNISVTVSNSGTLDLNGFNDTIGSLTLVGGAVTTGTGALFLGGNLTTLASATTATISGNLNLNSSARIIDITSASPNPALTISAVITGGGITKNGIGNVRFNGANTYAGATVVNSGFILLGDADALGTAAAGTTLNGGHLSLVGVVVAGEILTNSSAASLFQASGTSGWTSNIVLNAELEFQALSGNCDVSGVISGVGDIIKTVAGTLTFSGGGANTYTGTTYVNGGTLALDKSTFDGAVPGDLIIGDGTGGPDADVVRLLNSNQIANNRNVTISSSGLFDLNGDFDRFNSLSGSGNMQFGSGGYAIPGDADASSTYSGVASGAGYIRKVGNGVLTLTGTNTYTGQTRVNEGTLLVNGSQPQSPVQVDSTGTLGGSGTVGIILGNGNLAPGSSAGCLTSSNVTFSATGDYYVELNGPTPCTGYDQLNVRGTNNLGNAGLGIDLAFMSPVGIGQQFTIISNDGADPITGIFVGYPEGSTWIQNGFAVSISYVGGSGNDVVLTLTDVPGASLDSLAKVSTGNGNGFIDPNECNQLNVVITNETGTAMTSVSAELASLTEGVAVTQPFAGYSDIAGNGKGTNATAFQISTAPTLVCGTTINLRLTVTTASHGSFIVPVTLTSGSGLPAAAPLRYDNNTSTNIPDVGTIESTNTVAGFTGPLLKVAVSMWLTHQFDADLNISLISPDGVIVDLSSGNGAGANFGSACSPDGSRTTFDASGATSITAGSPPYVGTFQPEGSLAALNGGTANGNWRLRVQDTSGGTLGNLRCWSLFLYPADCAPGGGVCELCPNVTINAATGPASFMQNGYVIYDGTPSSCGAPKVCPGTSVGGSFPSDNYVFRNGPSNACITVSLVNTSSVRNLITVYTNSYNPANPDKCVNYLADGGNIVGGANPTQSFSFDVGAEAVFVVNVIGDFPMAIGPYQLALAGGDCRPVLNVSGLPGNKVLLDWTTAAGGYQLESTNALVTGGTSVWPSVTNSPIVVGGRFYVTNNVVPANRFYHLRKPMP